MLHKYIDKNIKTLQHHNMLCINVMDGWHMYVHVEVCVSKLQVLYVCYYLHNDARGKENCRDFGRSVVSRLRWLDGQQAAEFEVLNHRKLLQTLETGGQKRQK